MTVSKKCLSIIFIAAFLLVQGCGVLFFKEEDMARKKYLEHEAQFAPYRLQNTVEGYREFIAKYPKNMFISRAQENIENLQFAPYEQADNIESYMEFTIRYPENKHVFKAKTRIEQVEYKRYEKMDTIEAYREFLVKYPESIFALLAKDRQQELEFRAFDITLQKKYGFDLLLYRLNIRRLKKKLQAGEGADLAGFTPFASIAHYKGKKYFHTHLIYSAELSSLDATSREAAEKFFKPVVSKMLAYLDKKFTNKSKIDGFSFDVASSPHRFYGDRKILLEYYFPISQVRLFAQSKMDGKELLAKSMIVFPKKPVRVAKKSAPGKSGKAEKILGAKGEAPSVDIQPPEKPGPPPPKDGLGIMAMVRERDRGRDSIISRCWERVFPGGRKDTMKTIGKRKNYMGKKGIVDKSTIKYIDVPRFGREECATAILTVNYKKQQKAFWYVMRRGDAGRTANPDRYRPPAESDFCLTDYVEINANEEKHNLLRNEVCEDKPCSVVESTPVKKNTKYGKRISWIDRENWIPLKTEYFDEKGDLWKILHIEWQSKYGLWFWKKAKVENVQTGCKTFITTDDVRINLGLHDRDFTRFSLERMTGR
jgi:hypothetical protein